MKKDNVELICNISELSGLFKEKGDIRGFLQKVVQTIAEHMKAEVCSIYLLNETTGRLVLEATEGLNRGMVGTFSLDKGEGLVGRAFIELRSILEEKASRNPFYKYIPEMGEERYEAFLAVPIMLGLTKIGVLVLQHSRPGYFEQSDNMALKAIASQLAATLENVRLLMSIRDKRTPAAEESQPGPELVKGTSIVEGIAFGKAFIFADGHQSHGLSIVCHECYGETLADFEAALDRSEAQLEELQGVMEEDYSDVASMIFSAHLLMLRDESYSGAMKDLIREGLPPFQAVIRISNQFIDFFAAMDNPRLQEKTQDIKDLSHRLLRNLSTDSHEEGDYTGQIIIASELFPSELIKLAAQHVEGLVLVGGNASAHVSILARSLGVPTIITDNREAFQIRDNAFLILDSRQGNLVVNPSEETLEQYRGLYRSERKIDELTGLVKDVTRTADGQRIHLLASINLLSDMKAARALKAEGVGLYRSEFPFLIRNDFPSEEEQYLVYRKLTDSCGGPVTLRALDVGGDKILSYLPDSRENNPFLGLRAIRFLLQNKKIFVGQLKAMLRAGKDHDIRILFPLVSSVEDFQQARRMVYKSMEFLDRDGMDYNRKPRLGAMIELPSAVECVEDLAEEADFLSIGTNDLVQYMLGVDRTNDRVAGLYLMEHPAILRAVKRIASAARKKRCDLSVCGNLTGNYGMLYYFIGLGIRNFSLNPVQIPDVQQFVERVDRKKAAADARKLVRMKTTSEIQGFLEEILQTPSAP